MPKQRGTGELVQGTLVGVVLADAGYGHNTQFRTTLTQLGLQYVGGVETTQVCGNRGSNPYRPHRESQAVEPSPNVCNAIQLINRFR